MNENSKYRNAITYAFKKYDGLKRDISNLPYIIHPIRMLSILREFGYDEFKNENMMISVLLHDLVEDTSVKIEELENLFGIKVSLIVRALTQPKEIDHKEDWLKWFEFFSKDAQIIKMVDQIDNLLDMEENSFSESRKSKFIEESEFILKICEKSDINLALKLKSIIDKNKKSKV
jgi:(p)ppGpp synthase/HD superfamily hydrolase